MMKTYNAVFNEAETKGVFGISLVEDPAMQGNFVALSAQKIEFKEVNQEKRLLIGLVLEPNKPIYRNQGGEEFNIVFNEDTVRNLSYNFFKANHHKNSTIEHSSPIEGVTFVESWIVDDPKQDKSAYYGFSYPKGSWIATMKVDSDEVWNDYVKQEKVLGFSIDAMIKLEEVKLNKQMEKTEKTDFLSQLKAVLGIKDEPAQEPEKVEFGSVKTEDGSVTLEYDGEVLEAGVPVYIMTEDGQKVPAPVGEHKLEGGNILVVAEEGIAQEVKPTATEEPQPEAMAEETPQATAPQAEVPTQDDLVGQIKSMLIKYSSEKQEEKESTELVELKATVAKLQEELVAFKDAPAARAKKSQPTQVEFANMTEFQKRKYYRDNA